MSRGTETVYGLYPGACDTEPTAAVGPVSRMNTPDEYTARWECQSYLELGALPSAVPSARLHARLVVGEWGLGELAGTIELVVGELTTNAVRASEELSGSQFQGRWTPGRPPVRLWLQSDRSRILIQVWDGSDLMPQRQEPGSTEDGGRGLLLVESLCAGCGTYLLEGASGKVVWGRVESI
jgi:anti-sigma regulatory factor (Ser/Thr protein kinase)